MARADTPTTAVIDESDPAANMYGCLPCPKCGSRFRWPNHNETRTGLNVVCDECGLVQPAVRKDADHAG